MNKESLLSLFSYLADAAPATNGAGTSGLTSNIIIMVLLFGAMWFLLIAPQRKKQKQHAEMIQKLGAGDNVLTAGGIYGVITNVKEDRFIVKIADNTRIEVTKSAIQGKIAEEESQKS